MGRIIHVDNSSFFRKAMKIFLTELGLQSEAYELGEDAINAVMSGKVSCLIIGLELSDMRGEELLDRIDLPSRSMTVIAVTGSGNEDRIEKLRSMGVKATINKGKDWKEKLREYF